IMRKILLLICLFVVAVGYSQQTSVKANGVDNPIIYNQQQRTNPVVTPSTLESEVNTQGVNNPVFYNPQKKTNAVEQQKTSNSLPESVSKSKGENNPVFYNQQKKTNVVEQQKNSNSSVLSVPKSEGGNNPIFFNKQQNTSKSVQSTTSDISFTGRSATDIGANIQLEKSIFGSSGFSTSGIQGKTIDNPAAGTASAQLMGHRPEAPVVITHSLSQSIVVNNSVTC